MATVKPDQIVLASEKLFKAEETYKKLLAFSRKRRKKLITVIARITKDDPNGCWEYLNSIYWIDKRIGNIITQGCSKVDMKFVPKPTQAKGKCVCCKKRFSRACATWHAVTWVRKTGTCPACLYENKMKERAERRAGPQTWGGRDEYEDDENLKYLKSCPYSEYLQSEHWKDIRLMALRRASFRCQLCNAQDKLNVHHRTYERRGEELLSDLTVLCEPCHAKHHGKEVKP